VKREEERVKEEGKEREEEEGEGGRKKIPDR